MMRRAALDDVGPYDPMLASLPDFDMWVRLGMRHDLRLLHQPLTAFRVLDQERNASRGDENRRRGEFERVQVLKHYRRLAAADLRMIFAADIARFGINPEQSSNVLLSDLGPRVRRARINTSRWKPCSRPIRRSRTTAAFTIWRGSSIPLPSAHLRKATLRTAGRTAARAEPAERPLPRDPWSRRGCCELLWRRADAADHRFAFWIELR